MTNRSIAFIVKDQHPVTMSKEDTVRTPASACGSACRRCPGHRRKRWTVRNLYREGCGARNGQREGSGRPLLREAMTPQPQT